MTQPSSVALAGAVRKYVFERFPLLFSATIPRPLLELTVQDELYAREIADVLLVSLRAWLLKGQRKQVNYKKHDYPSSWWQHFKLECFPAWLLRRFPVQYAFKYLPYEEVIHVCPHANYDWPDKRHLQFLTWAEPPTIEAAIHEDRNDKPVSPPRGDREGS